MTDKKQLKQARCECVERRIWYYKRDMAQRLAETRKLFDARVYAVDIHTHSNYSDGVGTVMDNYERAKHAGLDFIFATDHSRIGQKRIVRKWADASWGQEPSTGAGIHHIGLLCNKRIFRAGNGSLSDNLQRAGKIAPFVWIPHPVGWYPTNWYPDKAIDMLWNAGEAFAVEVINGALKIVRAYDQFDAKAVTVWDRLLCDGKKVTAVGGSDAHCPDDIGTVWTGVFAKTRTATSLIKALNNGLCFASEAGLLDFSCNGLPMGSTVRKRKGTKLELRFRVADAAGIAQVRIVSQGKVLKEIHARGRTLVEDALTQKAGSRSTYYRLESASSDDRRTFCTPIYLEPQG